MAFIGLVTPFPLPNQLLFDKFYHHYYLINIYCFHPPASPSTPLTPSLLSHPLHKYYCAYVRSEARYAKYCPIRDDCVCVYVCVMSIQAHSWGCVYT